jgi:hypothetical protein
MTLVVYSEFRPALGASLHHLVAFAEIGCHRLLAQNAFNIRGGAG